jgi:carbamoyl-phosphate synthase small subunit
MIHRYLARVPQFARGLATPTGAITGVPATLHLKTGESFYGKSFGAPKSIFGETVFSTSITSCMCRSQYRLKSLQMTIELFLSRH